MAVHCLKNNYKNKLTLIYSHNYKHIVKTI